MMSLSWVNHTHHKPFVDETRGHTNPIRPGCFHDYEDLAWDRAGRLELVYKTGIAFGRLIDRKRPTGFRPGSLGSNHCGLCGNIDPNEKRIGKYCLVCMHSNLPLLQVFPGFSLGCLTPTGCQRSSARDAWSTPQDTVQSSDNLESWGTLFAPRSRPPLSYGPHHDPGAMLIIRAVHAAEQKRLLPGIEACWAEAPALAQHGNRHVVHQQVDQDGDPPHQPHIIAFIGVLKTAVETFDGGVTELYPDTHGCILRLRCSGIILCEIHPFAHESQS